jgi:hypothetical protein
MSSDVAILSSYIFIVVRGIYRGLAYHVDSPRGMRAWIDRTSVHHEHIVVIDLISGHHIGQAD